MRKLHSFHIPVMGIGFTVDTPLKVSKYGISSVMSIGDDTLLEKLTEAYCNKSGIPYHEITDKTEDYRAKRITSHLNLINKLAEKKFEKLKRSVVEKSNEMKEYLSTLPDSSWLKEEYYRLKDKFLNVSELEAWVKENFTMGSIDVNIMTKLDKPNFAKGVQLPNEFNDAHAAFRGFANSDLNSSIVLSAGLNPRLYSYAENFDCFYPSEDGALRKKLVLKVSDYRSALIQGKFLAKKGLWVSEYRIESGLNCGGHAFASDGYLMGPILKEFKENKAALIDVVHQLLVSALTAKKRTIPKEPLPMLVTAQGGLGTAEEHDFLMSEYDVDSVGWGTPFLLVPEVTSVGEETMDLLAKAEEKDLYLSNVSPLGVPFNSVRGASMDVQKMDLVKQGKAGSTCPKRFLISNTEFTERPICTASRKYQRLKLAELEKETLTPQEKETRTNRIVEKACLCVGLGTTALSLNNIKTTYIPGGVSICPGPNLAYFNRKMSLNEMIDHIYGRTNVITRTDRPNMFVKELGLYLDYLSERVEEAKDSMNKKQEKYLRTFVRNMNEGVDYYQELFSSVKVTFDETKALVLTELEAGRKTLDKLSNKIENQINK